MPTEEPHERSPLVPPSAKSLLWEPISWLSVLAARFTNRLLLTIVIGSHLLKGFVAGGGDAGLLGRPMEFILSVKPYCLNALEIQVATAVALTPWGLKPLLGTLSDRLPICGYHRLPYILIASVLGICGCSVLAYAAVDEDFKLGLPLSLLLGCLFLCFLQVATVDLLLEARNSEEVKAVTGGGGAELVRFNWIGINAWQILGIVAAGYLVQCKLGAHWCYVAALPFMVLVLLPVACNYLKEPVVDAGTCPVGSFCDSNRELLLVTLIVSVSVLLLAGMGLMAMDIWAMAPVVVVCAMAVFGSIMMFIRPEVAKPTAYYFLYGVLSLRLDGALFFFFTDCAENYEDGPHFSAWFYVTGLGLSFFTGCFCGILTCEWFREWSYQGIAGVMGFMGILARAALLPLLTRHVRGPVLDPAYAIAVFFTEGLFEAWAWIPRQVMNSMLTPMKLEASGLSVVSGTLNMARTLSMLFGACLLCALKVNPEGKPRDEEHFENLPLAYGICCVIQLVALGLVPILLPSGSQSQQLISTEKFSATYGSLWHRLKNSD